MDQDIGSVVLTDPRPIELIVETSRRIVLRPRGAGVTNLTVISKTGAIIYEKDIVITNRGDNYVRVTRYCEDNDCEEEDIYYCPYGCYGVQSLQENDAPGTVVNGAPVNIESVPATPMAEPQ